MFHSQGSTRSIFIYVILLIFVFGTGACAVPTYSPTEGKSPLKVYFTFPGGEECDSVQWTFGDKNSSTAITADHTYNKLGMYYPTCSCQLPGANVSYKYDYVYVIPWTTSIRDSSAGGRPTDVQVTRSSEGLSPEQLEKQAGGLAAIGQMQYAAEAYGDLLTTTSPDQKTLTSYGDVLVNLGRFAEAETIFTQALSTDENSVILKKLADTQFSQGKTSEAIETMNRTLSLAPDDASSYASYATFLNKAGKINEALDAYNQSFKLNDAQPQLWNDYANLLLNLGRLSQSADAYKHAIDIGQGGADIWDNYSQVLQKLGRKEDAQRAKEQATKSYVPVSSYGTSDSIPICSIGSMG